MGDSRQRKGGVAAGPRTGGTLGTFAGVFTPSVLTILGIILFLRTGYVIGSAGLPRALVMILLANMISVLTSFSLATIATNLRVKKGGDYYLISRTLGVAYGGALGLVLFLAQSVSIAFYAIGFGEAVTNMLPTATPWLSQVIAAAAVGALFVLAWLGADAATRFQFVVMGVLLTAILAFFWGGIESFDSQLVRENLSASSDSRFWIIFAIFFPAVTGFTQGVSMSGDLRDPGKSLPRGTFLAVGVSACVYFVSAVLFAGALPGSVLVSDFGAMRIVAKFSWLVDAGVIAATLSSALASFLGAPRILQSLAQDRVFPLLNGFSKGYGQHANPRRGVVLAALIAFGTIALGNLNVIAPVVSMFFLISYGLINYATYMEARSNSPSFRPTFRWYHPRLSLLGFVSCAGAMIAIQATAAAISIAILFAIYNYLTRTVAVERWADSSRSGRMQRLRGDLHAITSELEHARDWRPVLLAFSDDPGRRERLIRFSSWLEGGSGFTTAVRILEGEGAGIRKQRLEMQAVLESEIKKNKLDAYGLVVAASELQSSLPVILQAHGLAAIRTNTVILNWYDQSLNESESPGLRSYGQYLRMALRFDCNVVMLKISTDELEALNAIPSRKRRIDVWYRDDATGRLMLLLAYLLTRSEQWQGAKIRLLAPTGDQSPDEKLEYLKKMLEEARIAAEPVVVGEYERRAVLDNSLDASVVFLPFRLHDETPLGPFDGPLDELVRVLRTTAMVLAARDINLDAEPEEGPQGAIAQALDASLKAAETARKAIKDVEETAELSRKAKLKLEDARAAGLQEGDLTPLTEAAQKAQEKFEDLQRRAAKLKAKAEVAAQEARALTGESQTLEGSES